MTNTNSKLDEILTIDTSVYDDIIIETTTDVISGITVDTIDISSIASSAVDTITLEDSHWADKITWEQTEFEDTMPSLDKVENMCKEYPALDKAYENFRTVYAMVHQDWIGKNKDEELPF